MNISRRLIGLAGIEASMVMSIGSLVTALSYRGLKGERYSFLNHFISELGQTGVSNLAPLFNVSLMVAGLLILLFMVGLGLYIKSAWGNIVVVLGAFSAISCGLVGVFPMNHLSIHVKVADGFFYGILVTIFVFTIGMALDKNAAFSMWIILPGLLVVLAVLSFLIVPHFTNTNHLFTLNPAHIIRPRFWPNAFLEWSVFFTVLLWMLVVSGDVIRQASISEAHVTTIQRSIPERPAA